MFWDGRAPSLEGQAQGPIQNKIEMGNQSYQARSWSGSGPSRDYQGAVPRKVFGTEVTLDGMAKAIASFERTALVGRLPLSTSYLDRPTQTSPKTFKAHLTESQKRGMVLFGLAAPRRGPVQGRSEPVLKKANCTACHAGFNFTDEQFHNIGVGYDVAAGRDLPTSAGSRSRRSAPRTER